MGQLKERTVDICYSEFKLTSKKAVSIKLAGMEVLRTFTKKFCLENMEAEAQNIQKNS